MWFQINHFPEKGICFGKLTNVTFGYLLGAIIIQQFKQILRNGH